MERIQLPEIPLSPTSQKHDNEQAPKLSGSFEENPFRMPSDTEVFALRNKSGGADGRHTNEGKKYVKEHRRTFKALLAEDDEDDGEKKRLFEKLKAKKDADSMLISQQSRGELVN
jgi:hypothetical protein